MSNLLKIDKELQLTICGFLDIVSLTHLRRSSSWLTSLCATHICRFYRDAGANCSNISQIAHWYAVGQFDESIDPGNMLHLYTCDDKKETKYVNVVNKNIEKAIKWLCLGIDKQDYSSPILMEQYAYVIHYFCPLDHVDRNKRVDLLTRSIQLGNISSYSLLGIVHMWTIGEHFTAIEAWKAGASKGNVDCMLHLGKVFVDKSWFLMAAEKGSARALKVIENFPY
jgi:hypothetical protein